MRTKYDPETDALYLRFTDVPVAATEEVLPGVMVDFDAKGRILAVEILEASEQLNENAMLAAATTAEFGGLTPAPRKQIDAEQLTAVTATMPVQEEEAATFIRAMRDGDRD